MSLTEVSSRLDLPLLPRPHQREALTGLARTLDRHRRAQLHMACGTGKTYVGAWYAQRCDARTVIVLTPSLALVAQAAQAWRDVHPDARLLIVCSDATTAAGIAERPGGEDPYAGQIDRGNHPAVTTRPDVIAAHLDSAGDPTNHQLTLLIGTYHSAGAIARALTLTDHNPQLDLLVCDEAHQLAGRVSEAFATALRDAALPVTRRLFMTATPVHLGNLADDDALDDLERLDDDRRLLTMDDETVFGPVAYRLSAGEAIARGLLADYQVLVVAGDEQDDPGDQALCALADAVRRHQVRRVLTFHNRVAAARRFAAAAAALGQIGGVPIRAEAVDGSMRAATIRQALGRLGDPAADAQVTVVASAQVLREGVDVPAVDAVLFADPRTSNVDIVQAVGRALRLHPGKKHGTIVVPLAVRHDEDDDDQLAASRYGQVWRVLRALRAHDDRVAEQLDAATRRWNSSSGAVAAPGWLEIVGVPPADLDRITTRLVRGGSTIWEHWFGLFEREASRLGSAARVTTSATLPGGRQLGVWLGGQRHLHTRGLLHPDKVGRFEQLPGWSWSSAAAADQRTVDSLLELAVRAGTVAENDRGPSAYQELCDGLRRPMGLWLARVRQAHRVGALDRVLVEQLEQLPGWTWEPLQSSDRAAIEALRSFVAWEKHVDVPSRHVEGDVELGRWVLACRRRQLLGQLPPSVRDELLSVAPLGHKGATTWSWDITGTRWRLGASALTSYVRRTGSCSPMPVGHTEAVTGHPVALYQWAAVQRFQHGKGLLAPDRVAWLSAQPGWLWRSPGVTQPAGTPLDLQGHPHGTAKGAATKCPCQACLDYGRRFGRQSTARHRAIVDAVPAGAYMQRLQQLQQQVQELTAGDRRFEGPPGANAIATAAQIPVGVVRELLAGSSKAVSAKHATAVLNLTAHDVLELFDTVGSRGRLVMSSEQLIDGAPTRALLADLACRGFHARWVARELGYRQLAVKMATEQVARRIARQVADLHVRVGERQMPPAGSGRLPSLEQLLADAATGPTP